MHCFCIIFTAGIHDPIEAVNSSPGALPGVEVIYVSQVTITRYSKFTG